MISLEYIGITIYRLISLGLIMDYSYFFHRIFFSIGGID